MANPNLFSTYTDTNKLTSQGLTVTYDQQYTPAQGEVAAYWTVTRYARKSYSYIALTEAAAYSCAAAKRAQYTRAYKRIDSSSGSPVNISTYCCGADVTPVHESGAQWRVDISVNETDVKYSANVVNDLETYFASENGRSYDGGESTALTLDTAERTDTTASYTYTQAIGEDFDANRLAFQWKREAETTWHYGTTVPATVALHCRLVYGLIESNTVTIPEEE